MSPSSVDKEGLDFKNVPISWSLNDAKGLLKLPFALDSKKPEAKTSAKITQQLRNVAAAIMTACRR